jgi:peptidylprolyl isomerase
MKLRSLAAALTAFALSSGIALAQTAPSSSSTSTPAANDKTLVSYGVGYQMARDLADNNADLDVNTLVRGIQDGYAKRPPAMPEDKLAAAVGNFQTEMAKQLRAKFEKALHDNKARSDAFLAANRAKPGVVVLPSGVQYRVIEPGSGVKPTLNSTVDIHVLGTISTGQPFLSTLQNQHPLTVKVTDTPIGLREALVMMPIGSRWEVYLPSDKAYGDGPSAEIGPGQAVIFDVKLLNVK